MSIKTAQTSRKAQLLKSKGSLSKRIKHALQNVPTKRNTQREEEIPPPHHACWNKKQDYAWNENKHYILSDGLVYRIEKTTPKKPKTSRIREQDLNDFFTIGWRGYIKPSFVFVVDWLKITHYSTYGPVWNTLKGLIIFQILLELKDWL